LVLFEFFAGLMKLQHRHLNIKCNSTLHPVIGKLGTLVLLENGPKSMKGIGYSSLSRTLLQEFAFTDNCCWFTSTALCSHAWCARDSTFASSPQTYATAAFGVGRVREGANLLIVRCRRISRAAGVDLDRCALVVTFWSASNCQNEATAEREARDIRTGHGASVLLYWHFWDCIWNVMIQPHFVILILVYDS